MPLVVKGFAFGLQWFSSISGSNDEVQVRAKQLKVKAYAEAEHESSRMYGFGNLKRWKGIRAAAACVAEALPEGGGLFIHKIDKKGATCLIAVDGDRHLPIPGMDMYGPRLKMIEAANAYIATMCDQEVKVYGDVEPGEIDGAHEIVRLDFERIASNAVITGLFKPVADKDTRWAVIPLLVMGLGAVFYSEEIENFISPQALVIISPAEAYKTQVKTAVDSVLQMNQFPSSVMSGFMPLLATVPSEAGGWEIEKLHCVDTDCEATWRRREGGTSEGFMQALKLQASDTTVWFPDMDTAKRKLTLSKGAPSQTLMLAPNATFAQVVGTWFQSLSDRGFAKANVGTLQPIVAPHATDMAEEKVPQFGTYQFTIPLTEIDLQAVASLPDLMTIEKIELSRAGGTTMTVQFNGKYYAL